MFNGIFITELKLNDYSLSQAMSKLSSCQIDSNYSGCGL